MRGDYDEFWMTTTFRLKALAFGASLETQRLLMQHYGLPTRLLDWTESPLLAAFFAAAQWLNSDKPESKYVSPNMAVWMLQPIALNELSGIDAFPNTWTGTHYGHETFRLPFHPPAQHAAIRPSTFPLAVQASAVDRRVAVQRSCFTIQGLDRTDLDKQLSFTDPKQRGMFMTFTIPRSKAPNILAELDGLGISFSTVYPDLPGLAQELKLRFGPPRRFETSKRSKSQ
jgi:hypothetical protein